MIQRNDIEGAVAALRAGVADGTWTSDLARLYLRHQDDPTELGQRWAELADSDPEIGAYVERLGRNQGPNPEPLVAITRPSDEFGYSPEDLDELYALHQEFASDDGD